MELAFWSNRDIEERQRKVREEANRAGRVERRGVQEMDIDDFPEAFFEDSDDDML